MTVVTLENYVPPASAIAFETVRLEAAELAQETWAQFDELPIDVDATPATPDAIPVITSSLFPYDTGWIRVLFVTGGGVATLPSDPIYVTATTNGGIAGMVPRFRRALEGPVAASASLSDSEVRAIIADAVAEVIFYAPDWGKTLVVTARDSVTAAPTDFEVFPELTLPEQTVAVAQAALTWFSRHLQSMRTSERISDEGSSWEYTLSASALAAWLKQLVADRDRALDMIAAEADGHPLDQFASFLATRDYQAALVVEPWGAETLGLGGQQLDPRFG